MDEKDILTKKEGFNTLCKYLHLEVENGIWDNSKVCVHSTDAMGKGSRGYF